MIMVKELIKVLQEMPDDTVVLKREHIQGEDCLVDVDSLGLQIHVICKSATTGEYVKFDFRHVGTSAPFRAIII